MACRTLADWTFSIGTAEEARQDKTSSELVQMVGTRTRVTRNSIFQAQDYIGKRLKELEPDRQVLSGILAEVVHQLYAFRRELVHV